MDALFTTEHRVTQTKVRHFVREEVTPIAHTWDRAPDPATAYPRELVRKASQLGLRTLALPKSHGGGGADFVTQLIVCEELAVGDLGFAEAFDATLSWSYVLFKLANADQRQRLIPGFRDDDEFMLAHAMTEREAGSDNMLPATDPDSGLRTDARREGDDWIINGRKQYIANGNIAKLVFVMARTDHTRGVLQGCTLFAVPAGTAGFTVGGLEDKLGQRSCNNAELFFDGCRVPDANRIGPVNGGLELLGTVSNSMVLKTAASALGVARAAYDAGLGHARHRVQGGRPIVEHQAVGMMLADMLMKIEAGRSLLYRLGVSLDRHGQCDRNLSRLVKVFACEAAVEVTLKAIEIFGGLGVMRDSPVEKFHRDAVTLLHSGGTQQVLRIKVAQALAGEAVNGW